MHSVSIIVPVFNSSEYIIACLASLCAQTMDDIEVILVDDHGTDDSIGIARCFVNAYCGPKQFIFAQTPGNSGPGAARNVGIDIAKGEYIAFVDSDDYVEPTYCEELYKAATFAGADLACCDIQIGEEEKQNADVSDKQYFLKHFVSYFTTFVYKKTMLDAKVLRFPESSSAEDTCFLTCCVLSANKIAQVHKPLYHYILHGESVSRRKNRRRALVRLNSIKSIIHFAKRNGLYSQYRCALNLLLLKKGYGMAVKDLIFG
ncbi:MAG: glycosyltransferase [Bacteroidales bacterium]|nr:glycosyltransferase [Bacteroidales bacterium]